MITNWHTQNFFSIMTDDYKKNEILNIEVVHDSVLFALNMSYFYSKSSLHVLVDVYTFVWPKSFLV